MGPYHIRRLDRPSEVPMRTTRARLLLGAALLLLALPLHAEAYTIKLTNGATFESRYQPKQAAFDPSFVTFIDETGLAVALPKDAVASVVSQSELKGYGRMINTTTIDLGYAPNDMPVQQQQASNAQLLIDYMNSNRNHYDQQQFVEPGQAGGGIPVWTAGASGGNNFSVFNGQGQGVGQAPAPAPMPQNSAPQVVQPQSPPQ
jgi:hypothetical protein